MTGLSLLKSLGNLKTNHVPDRIMRSVICFVFIVFHVFHMESQCHEKNTTFKEGERITYQAYYNWHFIWMHAGEVTFTTQLESYLSKPVYRLTSLGKTYKKYDFFYTVRDTFVSLVDTATLMPVLFHRKTNEGSYRAYETYRFDQSARAIHSSVTREKDPVEVGVLPWKDCTVDLLTMVYKARNIDFSKFRQGDKIPIRMVVDGGIHDLYIRYLGKETITTRTNRSFRCLKFSPLLMKGTIFEEGEDMTVWVTDDQNRLPVLVEAKILIGSVKAVFESARGLRHPITAEIISK